MTATRGDSIGNSAPALYLAFELGPLTTREKAHVSRGLARRAIDACGRCWCNCPGGWLHYQEQNA
jgi:hypothetical protein